MADGKVDRDGFWLPRVVDGQAAPTLARIPIEL